MSASYVPVRGDSPPRLHFAAWSALTSMLELKSVVRKPVCTANAAEQGRHAVCDRDWRAPQVTVVLRNVFQPDDFEAEPALREELEADMLSECAKLGAVDKVRARGSSCGQGRACDGQRDAMPPAIPSWVLWMRCELGFRVSGRAWRGEAGDHAI